MMASYLNETVEVSFDFFLLYVQHVSCTIIVTEFIKQKFGLKIFKVIYDF